MKAFRLIVAALVLGSAGIVCAQSSSAYPSQPVRIIVPFPPGGTVDIVARVIAKEFGERLGAQIVVENRGGAGGTIGTQAVATAARDGYTLLITGTHQVINPGLMKKLPYDAKKDFTPLAMLASAQSVLVVNAALPARTADGLAKASKEARDPYNFGSTGLGGVNHLTGELFKIVTGARLVHIPYKGAAPAMADLIGGHIPVMFDSPPTVASQVKAGAIRALAISGTRRSTLLPDVPTFREAGINGMEAIGFVGMFGPANLPDPVRSAIDAALAGALDAQAVKSRIAELGLGEPSVPMKSFADWCNSEMDRWSSVVAKAGITVE